MRDSNAPAQGYLESQSTLALEVKEVRVYLLFAQPMHETQ